MFLSKIMKQWNLLYWFLSSRFELSDHIFKSYLCRTRSSSTFKLHLQLNNEYNYCTANIIFSTKCYQFQPADYVKHNIISFTMHTASVPRLLLCSLLIKHVTPTQNENLQISLCQFDVSTLPKVT